MSPPDLIVVAPGPFTLDDSPDERGDGGTRVSKPTVSVTLGALLGVIVIAVVAFSAATFAARLEDVIGITLAAATLALLTSPPQRAMERRLGSIAATIITALGTLAFVLGMSYVVLRDLSRQASAVADLIRSRLADVRTGSLADRTFDALQLDSTIDEWLRKVPSAVVVGDTGGTHIGLQLVALFAIVILAAFFQSSAGSITNWFVARWPRDVVTETGESPTLSNQTSPRLVVREFLFDLDRRGVGSVRRSLVLALASAAVVAFGCWVCGLPGSTVVGLWAGAWFVVPTVGWAVGLAPIGLLAALDTRPITIVALIVGVTCALATTVARRRFVDRATIRIGPAPHVVAVGCGIAIAGFGGSLVVLVLVSVLAAGLTNTNRPGAPTAWSIPAHSAHRIGAITLPGGWRSGLLVIGSVCSAVLLWALIHRAAPAIVWLLIGGFIAIAVGRPVSWLESRTRLTHQISGALFLTVLGAVMTLVIITGAQDGARTTATVTDQLPTVVAQLEQTQFIGGWLSDHNASVWVEAQVNDLPQRLGKAQPSDWLPALGGRVVDLFWTMMFAVALLLDGPRLLNAANRSVPARHRRQYSRLIRVMASALGGYAAGAAMVAGINGAVVLVIAVALGVGLAPILAVWAFVWNFVPQIGGFMGGVPLVLFALVAGPVRGLIAGVLFVTYQFIENHLIQPAIIGAAIDVAPWGTLLAALAGGAAAGVIGAVVLTPLVGVVRVVRAELGRDDFPGNMSRVDPVSISER